MRDTGYRIQDTGDRIQDTGDSIQDAGYRTQDTGHRGVRTGWQRVPGTVLPSKQNATFGRKRCSRLSKTLLLAENGAPV